MSDDAADDAMSASDLVDLVRERVGERARAEFVEVREATSGHVDIVLEEWEEDGQRSHYLYRVTREPNLDSGTHLHWEALGEVVDDE